MLLKYIFITFAVILAVMITVYKLYVQKLKRNEKTASYVSVLTWAFALYIFSAFVLVFFINGGINKTVIILFALSPFIIGKLATYQKESLYSIIQILCAVISAGYVYFL